jgi:hypothetical protein
METERLLELDSRERIRDCIARVSRGEDRRDAQLLKSCFWPDASDDHGIFVGSFSEYLAWVVPGAAAVINTQHTLGQSLIELQGQHTAVAETHVTAYHRIDMGSEQRDIVIGGRYLDRLEQRAGEWRIKQRAMMYDWLRDFGQSADWSHGVLGMPFLHNHAIGAARGDYSETFFTAGR